VRLSDLYSLTQTRVANNRSAFQVRRPPPCLTSLPNQRPRCAAPLRRLGAAALRCAAPLRLTP